MVEEPVLVMVEEGEVQVIGGMVVKVMAARGGVVEDGGEGGRGGAGSGACGLERFIL